MTKVQKFKVIILLSIFSFLFSLSHTQAAQLNLTSQVQELGGGQQFRVDLMLDAQGQSINAVEGEIVFPNELLELEDIRDGDSIINLWIERPRAPRETVFSGVIPGGFEGVLSPYYEGYRPGKIFSLIFQAKSVGEGIVEVKNAQALLHDGLGTSTELSISTFSFAIRETGREIEREPLVEKDTDLPEPFTPQIAKEPTIFDGKYFVVFVTQDKGSGIDHYEMQENRKEKIENRKWIEAESPYVLKDQALKSSIYVKAVDRAGNERIAVIPPENELSLYEKYFIWIIILVGILGLIFLSILWRKRALL